MTEDGTIEKARHFVVGANHLSSTAAVRDRLFVDEDHHAEFLRNLRAHGLQQALMISTCARTEVSGVHAEPGEVIEQVVGLLAAQAGLPAGELVPQLYIKQDEDAVRHTFSVVSSLDSPVLGEPQVTGQVRDSHRFARSAGMVGRELESILNSAYSAAKRVRAETEIGERPVSMAAAAQSLTRNVHGDITRCAGLMIVAGDMGGLIGERLMAAGLGRMVVTAPIEARAELAARHYGCHHAAFADLPNLLADADVVVSSLGTGEYVINAEMVVSALGVRRRRPILLVDAAIPGDLHPGIDNVDGAFLYNLDDLERVAMQGRVSRDAAAAAAGKIVNDEVAGYFRDVAGRSVAPVVTSLRDHFDAVRANVLAERPNGSAEEITRLLINRLLHHPSETMRRLANTGGGDELHAAELLRRLFDLSDQTGDHED